MDGWVPIFKATNSVECLLSMRRGKNVDCAVLVVSKVVGVGRVSLRVQSAKNGDRIAPFSPFQAKIARRRNA